MKKVIDLESNSKEVFFSFNLIRPKKGKFLVFLVVDEQKSLIAEFGKDFQKMYSIKRDSWEFLIDILIIKQLKERLFSIEVHPLDGANVEDFLDIAIEKFVEVPQKVKASSEDIHLQIPKILYPQFALQHKDANRICMPLSLTHALSILMDKPVDVFSMIEYCYDHGHAIYGNWTIATAAISSYTNGAWSLKIKIVSTLQEIKDLLALGVPICVSIQGELKGAYKIFHDGHIVTIVGIDSQFIYCLDSANEFSGDVLKKYCTNDFLSAWKRRRYIAFIFQKKN